MRFNHDGSHSNIHNVGTGNFHIRGNGTDQIKIQAKSGEQSIVCNSDGAVELYFATVKSLRQLHTTGNLELAGAGGNVSQTGIMLLGKTVIFELVITQILRTKFVLQNDTSWKAGFDEYLVMKLVCIREVIVLYSRLQTQLFNKRNFS